MYICKFCNNEYEVYPIIINDNMISLLIEISIREEHYNDANKIGICSNCRKKEVYDNKIFMAKLLLPISLKLELDEAEISGDDNGIKEGIVLIEQMRKQLMGGI